jgi:apolipoprotein N-acyltransferase
MIDFIMKSPKAIPAIQKKKWLPHPLTLLSGLLVVLAFPPWGFWPLIWVCLVPWFFAIRKADSRFRAFIEGFWLNFLMTLGGYYWIAYSLKEFGGVPWPVGIFGLLLFCLIGQPQFLLFPPLVKILRLQDFVFKEAQNKSTGMSDSKHKKIKNRTSWQLILTLIWLSLLYTGIDWFVPKMFLDTLGHAFYTATFLRQAADLGGAQLLTFLILIVNLSLFEILKSSVPKLLPRSSGASVPAISYQEHFSQIAPPLLLATVLVFGAFTYGWMRQAQVLKRVTAAESGIQIAAIQGNIGDFDKVAAENDVSSAALKIIDTFTSMTDQALNLSPRPEVVIWPETSFPSLFRQPFTQLEIQINNRVEDYVRDHGVPLLFGGYDRQFGKEYNSFFFLQSNGDLQTYHKSKLLMFGEYIPGADSIQFFKDSFPQVGNFGKGPGPQVFEVATANNSKKIRVAPIICYEALFTDFLVQSARNDSQLILNITNDSWFGTWGEPQLHLALTTFRSIETRLPMLRSTNTGISTLITATGEITSPTKIGTQEIMNVHVPITAPIWSLVKEWGDWFGPFALLLGLMGSGLEILSRRRAHGLRH